MSGDRPVEISLSLPRRPTAPSAARHRVEVACAGLPREVAQVAELLTSELVSNAVLHGAGRPRLRVSRVADVLRVEVHDDGRSRPRPAVPHPLSPGGRGLVFVDALSTCWGVEDDLAGPGKTVWFELRNENAGQG